MSTILFIHYGFDTIAYPGDSSGRLAARASSFAAAIGSPSIDLAAKYNSLTPPTEVTVSAWRQPSFCYIILIALA